MGKPRIKPNYRRRFCGGARVRTKKASRFGTRQVGDAFGNLGGFVADRAAGEASRLFFSAESSTVSLPMISRSVWFSLLSFPISRADTGSSGVLGQPGVDCASRDAMFFGELRDGDYVFTIAGRTGATLRVEAPNPIVRWGQHLGQGDGDCSQKAGRQTKPAAKTDAHQCSCSDHRGRISRLWSRAKWGCSQWVRVASHFEGGISRDRLRLPQWPRRLKDRLLHQ